MYILMPVNYTNIVIAARTRKAKSSWLLRVDDANSVHEMYLRTERTPNQVFALCKRIGLNIDSVNDVSYVGSKMLRPMPPEWKQVEVVIFNITWDVNRIHKLKAEKCIFHPNMKQVNDACFMEGQ